MFLNPHFGTIIWTLIIFSTLLYVLSKFAWKPLLQVLKDRERTVADSLQAAEEAELKIAAIKTSQIEAIEIARAKKEQIIKEGRLQAEKIVAEGKERAHAEAEKIIAEAKKRMVHEREAIINDLKIQMANLSLEIATKVVKADMEDRKRHEALISELIKEVELN